MLDRLEITDSANYVLFFIGGFSLNCVQLVDLLGLDKLGSYMERF